MTSLNTLGCFPVFSPVVDIGRQPRMLMIVANLLWDRDALLVGDSAALLGEDSPALLLLHHLALLLVVSLPRGIIKQRTFKPSNSQKSIKLMFQFNFCCDYPPLHWCSNTVVHWFSVTALQAGS